MAVYLSVSHHTCHLERNEVESRDLRMIVTFQVESVRRSLDSLRSLGMTSFADRKSQPFPAGFLIGPYSPRQFISVSAQVVSSSLPTAFISVMP